MESMFTLFVTVMGRYIHVFGQDIGRWVLVLLICITTAIVVNLVSGLDIMPKSFWLPFLIWKCGATLILSTSIMPDAPLLYESAEGTLYHTVTSTDGEQTIQGYYGECTIVSFPSPGRFLHERFDSRQFYESEAILCNRAPYKPTMLTMGRMLIELYTDRKIRTLWLGLLLIGMVLLAEEHGIKVLNGILAMYLWR